MLAATSFWISPTWEGLGKPAKGTRLIGQAPYHIRAREARGDGIAEAPIETTGKAGFS